MTQFKKSMQLVRLQIAVPISGACFAKRKNSCVVVY